jgi:hypothetical protein
MHTRMWLVNALLLEMSWLLAEDAPNSVPSADAIRCLGVKHRRSTIEPTPIKTFLLILVSWENHFCVAVWLLLLLAWNQILPKSLEQKEKHVDFLTCENLFTRAFFLSSSCYTEMSGERQMILLHNIKYGLSFMLFEATLQKRYYSEEKLRQCLTFLRQYETLWDSVKQYETVWDIVSTSWDSETVLQDVSKAQDNVSFFGTETLGSDLACANLWW